MDKDESGAKLSTARVCGRSLSGMAGSSPARSTNVMSHGVDWDRREASAVSGRRLAV